MTRPERPVSTSYAELSLRNGQHLRISCDWDKKEEILKALSGICSLECMQTKKAVTQPDSPTYYSRYSVVQHRYYWHSAERQTELLEIENPPDGKAGIVIGHRSYPGGYAFSEWRSLPEAQKAYSEIIKDRLRPEKLAGQSGFLRLVPCGQLQPWFWAIGDVEIVGDLAIPYGLQDDPVYRLGKRFIVENYGVLPVIKTCLGARYGEDHQRDHLGRQHFRKFRLIYWDDGSTTTDYFEQHLSVQPLADDDTWIIEQLAGFKLLLAGFRKELTIHLLDGGKITSKYVPSSKDRPSAEGNYYVIVHLKGRSKPTEGWTGAFVPSDTCPDIVEKIVQMAKGQVEIERVEVKNSILTSRGKKWKGVLYVRPTDRSEACP